MTDEEIAKYYGGSKFAGGNSRARGVRSRSIGWKPKSTTLEDLHRHVKQEVVRVEKAFGKAWKK